MKKQPDDPGVDPNDPFSWIDDPPLAFGSVIYTLIVMVIIALWAIAFTREARAHEWFTQKYNPVTKSHCCSGVDCFIIAEDKWWQEGKEIKVQWFDGQTYSIPINQALPSEDKQGRAAACVWGGQLRCFFLPVNG